MNTKKGYLMLTLVLSIVPVIVGMLMVLFSGSAYEKTVGLAIALIGPVVIWGVYGCAFFVFKG
jgi:heme A synthase